MSQKTVLCCDVCGAKVTGDDSVIVTRTVNGVKVSCRILFSNFYLTGVDEALQKAFDICDECVLKVIEKPDDITQ